MNVFELAAEYRMMESLLDSAEVDQDALLDSWMSVEGEINQKIENIGFMIRNREALLLAKKQAIEAMQDSMKPIERDIDRLRALGITLLNAVGKKKAGGASLMLSVVPTTAAVQIAPDAAIPDEYMRLPVVAPPVPVPDKEKLARDLKAGVVIEGVSLRTGTRLAIK
jgi:hypothetical protein